MLEDEMAKDEMVGEEVTWYLTIIFCKNIFYQVDINDIV